MPSSKCAKTIRLTQAIASVKLATPVSQARDFTQADLEAARREGYQRGFEDASAAIEMQLVEQREEVTHLQQKTFQAISSHHENLTRQVRAAIPELTMDIVGRVLGGMKPKKETIAKIVEEVLKGIAPGPGMVEVSLSEHDLKLISSYEGDFRERYPQIEFRADPDLGVGDCIVNSRFGALDGRVATKLRSVERLLQ